MSKDTNIRQFDTISFDTTTKTFTIIKGSEGVYPYPEIKKCSIVYEDSNYTGKSDLFKHQVLVAPLQPVTILPRTVYTGLQIEMKDGNKKYVYVIDKHTQLHTTQFYEASKKAEEIKSFIERIINKYK